MSNTVNRCQPSVSEDAEPYLPYWVLRKASLLPTRTMDWDSKWKGRNFVQLCKTPLASSFWYQNPQQSSVNTWCPCCSSRARVTDIYSRKNLKQHDLKKGLRLVVHMAHSTSAWCSIFSFPPTHHSSCHTKIQFELCSSKPVVSSCKMVNLGIWPQLKMISSKRKWTLGDKEAISVKLYPGIR